MQISRYIISILIICSTALKTELYPRIISCKAIPDTSSADNTAQTAYTHILNTFFAKLNNPDSNQEDPKQLLITMLIQLLQTAAHHSKQNNKQRITLLIEKSNPDHITQTIVNHVQHVIDNFFNILEKPSDTEFVTNNIAEMFADVVHMVACISEIT